jgi:hypothetical protein
MKYKHRIGHESENMQILSTSSLLRAKQTHDCTATICNWCVVHDYMIVSNEFTRKFSSDRLTKYKLSVIKEGADI